MRDKYFGVVKYRNVYFNFHGEDVDTILAKMNKTPVNNTSSFVLGIIETQSLKLVHVGEYFKGKEDYVLKHILLAAQRL